MIRSLLTPSVFRNARIGRLAGRLAARLPALAAVLVAALALAASPARAQDDTLKVGSTSPAITVADWTDVPVSGFGQGSRTWVLHFFEVNDAGSKRSATALNEATRKFRRSGLRVVGMCSDPLASAKSFATKSAEYSVAVDNEKQTYQAFMGAAKREGTNVAFVVRKGVIIWIGSPASPDFAPMIEKAVVGRYNPTLAKRAEPTIRAANEAIRVKNFKDAWRHFDAILAIDATFFGDIAVRKYKALAVDAGDSAGARAWGERMLSTYAEDPHTLTDLVDLIITDSDLTDRDYALAASAAAAVTKASERGDASGLALQAQVAFAKGDFAAAKDLQFKAWQAAFPSEKDSYKRQLDVYSKRAAKEAGAASEAKSGG
jgi:peroxiredoxin